MDVDAIAELFNRPHYSQKYGDETVGDLFLRVELSALRGAHEDRYQLLSSSRRDDPRFHFKRLFPLVLNRDQRRFLRECVAFFEEVTEATKAQILGGMINLNVLEEWFTDEYGKAGRSSWAKMPRDVGRHALWRTWKLFTTGGFEAWKHKRIPLLGFTDAVIDWPRIRITKLGWLGFDFSDIGEQSGLFEWFKNHGDRLLGVALYCDAKRQWQVIASFERRDGEQTTPYQQRAEARVAEDRKVAERVMRLFQSTGEARLTTGHVTTALGKDGMLMTMQKLSQALRRLGIKTKVIWTAGKAVRVLDRGTLEKLLSKSVDYN